MIVKKQNAGMIFSPIISNSLCYISKYNNGFLSKFSDPGTKTRSKSIFSYSYCTDIQGTIAKKSPKYY